MTDHGHMSGRMSLEPNLGNSLGSKEQYELFGITLKCREVL